MNIHFTDQGICEFYTVTWSVGTPRFLVLPFDVRGGAEVMEIFQDEAVAEFTLEMIPTFEQAHRVAVDLLESTAKRVEAGEIP